MPSAPSKSSTERAVRAITADPLRPVSTLIRRGDRLLFATMDACAINESNGLRFHASSILIGRASCDVRAALLLARNGYLLQSWGLLASLMEHAFTLGQVAASEENANRWLEHKGVEHGPWKVRQALKATLALLELDVSEAEYYRPYQWLCAAKHGNPTWQVPASARPVGDMMQVDFDPRISPTTILLSRFGLALGLRALSVGIWAAARAFDLPMPFQQRIVAWAGEVNSMSRQVSAEVGEPAA